MSNLWFFRLRRAEQQRRRSSGESVGSSSVQSVAGVSAASLPLPGCGSVAGGGPHNNSLPAAGDGAGQALPGRSANNSCLGDEQQDGSGSMRQSGEQAGKIYESITDQSADDRKWSRSTEEGEENDSMDLETRFRRPRRADQQHHHQQRRQQSAPSKPASKNFQHMKPIQTHKQPICVPQVTIIRSDSTSSFIPIEATTTSDNSGQQQQQQREAASGMRPIVCELNERSGSVESKCYVADKEDQRGSDQHEQDMLSKRGRIHDQLISGKVPPVIQDSALLAPSDGGNAGLSVADSMDNLAALIPR